MSFKFQLPPITAESGIDKLRSYLMQMTDQLEYALNNIETSNFTLEAQQQITKKPEQYTEQSVDEAVSLLKDLIVKNAEVIESHMDEISQELHGEYLAISSDFGTYRVDNDARVTANAEGLQANFNEIRTVQGSVSSLGSSKANADDLATLQSIVGDNNTWISKTDAYIHAGLLWTEGGERIVGIAMGQVETEMQGGEEVLKRQGFYTTYTPKELAFYLNTTKVAYVSNDKLFINKAVVNSDFNLGRYEIKDVSGKGLTIKWVG